MNMNISQTTSKSNSNLVESQFDLLSDLEPNAEGRIEIQIKCREWELEIERRADALKSTKLTNAVQSVASVI